MSLRRTVQDLLHKAGYDLYSVDRWGQDLTRDLLRTVPPDLRTVLDVGANRGQAARQFLQLFPRATVHSFEPNPSAAAQLRALADTGRLQVHVCALGESEGEMTLHLAEDDVGSSLLPWSAGVAPGQYGAWTRPAGAIRVPVWRLDAMWDELSPAAPAVLKVDTQGFDLQVLRGAGERLRPPSVAAVQVELNFADYYEGQGAAADVIALLVARGYAPVGFYSQAGGTRRADGRLNWVDALFA